MAKKKLVDVNCLRPFAIGHSSFAGKCKHIVLDTDGILVCLENKAKVNEVLADGTTIPLHFGNFNADNGPSDVDQKNAVTEDDRLAQLPPMIETITVDKARQHQEQVIEAAAEADNNTTPEQATPIVTEVKTEVKAPVVNKPETKATTFDPNPTADKKDDTSKKDDKKDDSKNDNKKK